jgi:hypothetical protein
MNILAALGEEKAKLQKQADKARQQLDAVRAAIKILGREVANPLKFVTAGACKVADAPAVLFKKRFPVFAPASGLSA